MSRNTGKIHPVQRGIMSKPTSLLPAKGGKRVRNHMRISSEVRKVSASEYNESGRGQHVFDQCAHKMGQFADIMPMSKESQAYKLAVARGETQ